MTTRTFEKIDELLREVALEAVAEGNAAAPPPSHPALAKLVSLGTELWLDTGNLEEASALWHREFSALTTNNTLANQVVQTGVLDEVAREAVANIRAWKPGISATDLVMELGFVVNCHIALRLVKAFGARVSVELHPDIACDRDRSVYYAERYHAVCPEKFTIKIPLTPEGYCAVARVREKQIPVNYTLGFSARQNYLAAVISQPSYVNVFLGRLNQVVLENSLGDGKYVGEKANMATQVALCELRSKGRTSTRLIAASMRSASQVADLAGCDVFTMPPKVAADFLGANPDPATLGIQVGREFQLPSDSPWLGTLWDVSEAVVDMTDALAHAGPLTLSGDDIRRADADFGTKLFRSFTDEERASIRKQGKIPALSAWDPDQVALDDLMTASALESFAVDQAALDSRLRGIAGV